MGFKTGIVILTLVLGAAFGGAAYLSKLPRPPVGNVHDERAPAYFDRLQGNAGNVQVYSADAADRAAGGLDLPELPGRRGQAVRAS